METAGTNLRTADLPVCREAWLLIAKRPAYLDHVRKCPTCQERAKQLTELARNAVMPEFEE